MPAPDVLPILPVLPHPWLPSLIDLLKVLGVPAALFLLARFITRRDKLRDTATDNEAKGLKERADNADAERKALRVDSAANKQQHAGLAAADAALKELVWQLDTKLHALEAAINNTAARNEGRDNATKDNLIRIEGQLTRLIDKFIEKGSERS